MGLVTSLKKLGPYDIAGNTAMIIQAMWDRDTFLRELSFEWGLLHAFTINSVLFSNRLMTDEELRKVEKLGRIGTFVMGPGGPRRNAMKGRHNIIDKSKTYAWNLDDDELNPEGACKHNIPEGRLSLGGTIVAGTLFIVSVTNRTESMQTFEASVSFDEPG